MSYPTTDQLDNFTRANENPIVTNWTTPIFTDYRDATELWTNTMGANPGDAYYDISEFGPNVEAWGTLLAHADSEGQGTMLLARIQGEGGSLAVASFYYVNYLLITGTWSYVIGKHVSGTGTELITATALGLTPAAGDSFGISVIEATVSFYWKVGAGVWTFIDSAVDPQNSIPNAGYIGAGWDDSSTRWSAFGGGNAAIKQTSYYSRRRMVRV